MKKTAGLIGIIFLAFVVTTGFYFTQIQAQTNRIIFFNKKAEGSRLYVSKKVIFPSGMQELAVSDSFRFILQLDGAGAKEYTYRLLDRDGREVFNYNGTLTTEYSKNQIPIPFQTDRNGSFMLKDGETACFDYLKPGMSYQVTESICPGYSQMEPSGGRPAVGTILPEGNAVVFQNQYMKEGMEGGSEAVLEVRKDLAFPAGFTPPESPVFSFTVFVNGRPWANEAYTVIHNASGRKAEEGVTDQAGKFHMKGGYTARFSSVPCSCDYRVSEESAAGWQELTPKEAEGAVKAPVTQIHFTNTEAAFAVSKTMSDAVITDEAFVFQLKKEGAPWKTAEYYLYNVSGQRIDDKVYMTDENGEFSLLADQAAIFRGIPLQTQYSVSEIPNSFYIQTLPAGVAGYENKQVSGALEILPFQNAINENAVHPIILSVLKKDSEGKGLEGAEFRICRGEAPDEEICRAVSGKDGMVSFGKIEPGIYYIQEIASPAGHSLLSDFLKLKIEKDGIWINRTFYGYAQKNPDVVFQDTKAGKSVCITVYNHRGFLLPFTGGNGLKAYVLCALSGLAGIIYLMMRRRQ